MLCSPTGPTHYKGAPRVRSSSPYGPHKPLTSRHHSSINQQRTWHQALAPKWRWQFSFLAAGSSQHKVNRRKRQSGIPDPQPNHTDFLSSFRPIMWCKMLSLKVIRLSCLVPARVITERLLLLQVLELLTADAARIKAALLGPQELVCPLQFWARTKAWG